jgi:uncharacterized protein (DUF433 family)
MVTDSVTPQGGNARIEGTRIPVWVLEGYRRFGKTTEDFLSNYPSLKAIDLEHAWAYADTHQVEMDAVIRLNEEA